MKQIICEVCQSIDLIKQNGVIICQKCGAKYSVESAKKKIVPETNKVLDNVYAEHYKMQKARISNRNIMLIMLIAVIIGILIFVLWNSKKSPQSMQPIVNSAQKTQLNSNHKINDIVQVGNMEYRVNKIEWRESIGNEKYLYIRARANFLIIDTAVFNGDKIARMIMSFHLIDENENKYDPDYRAGIYLDGYALFMTNLNSGAGVKGYIVFDVPKNKKYRLVLNGEFGSLKQQYIELY
ncbi:MAG: DUF4352 domain-containing protein [Endomicrobium sp.]|jgi:hypothetical protein|nr:DUF4352 domain-containing protein [Endomicrobium sp.]